MNNKPYFIALNRIEGVGPRLVTKLLRRWPNLEELFRFSKQHLVTAGLSERIAESIVGFNFEKIDEDCRWEETEGHVILTWSDPAYPALLKEIYDPPFVLYAIGDLLSFDQIAIAMVGSRKPSMSGCETAWRFAFELAKKNITIVSGLALGIDAQAHSGCLEAGGKTIAVMGTGIDIIYPSRHVNLAKKIAETGLLLSELPLKSSPIAGHFPRRNRIISGLSLSTMVVEAAIKSGSLITARLAMEQNRDVLAIPGSIYNPEARGCHQLLQEGATLVTSPAEVLTELGIEPHQVVRELPLELANESQNLVKFIGFEMTTVDQIIVRSGLAFEKVVCDLANLELQGVIRAIPGGYMRCTL